jgi:imidazoleglycerol phosphate dehydratase HisB
VPRAIQKVDAALGRLGAPASAAAPARRFGEAELHADEVVARVNVDVDKRPVTLLLHSRGAY